RIRTQALGLVTVVQNAVGPEYRVQAVPMFSQIGSGAMPVDLLPSFGLRIQYAGSGRSGRQLTGVQTTLRSLPTPVLGRLMDDAFWLDMRCLEYADQAGFVAQLKEPLM